MSFTIDITNWQKTSVFNEIVEALNERLIAVGDDPIALLPDYTDIQSLSVWTTLQQKVEILALKYLFSSADYSSVSSDIASFRAAAGLNEGGFRRMTQEGIGTYGTAQAYDIMGSWLWEDLIKGLKALTTISSSYLSTNPVDTTMYATFENVESSAPLGSLYLYLDGSSVDSPATKISNHEFKWSDLINDSGWTYVNNQRAGTIGKKYIDIRSLAFGSAGDYWNPKLSILHTGIVPVAFSYDAAIVAGTFFAPYSVDATIQYANKLLTLTRTVRYEDANNGLFISPYKITYGIQPAFRYT